MWSDAFQSCARFLENTGDTFVDSFRSSQRPCWPIALRLGVPERFALVTAVKQASSMLQVQKDAGHVLVPKTLMAATGAAMSTPEHWIAITAPTASARSGCRRGRR